jgi:hypothetical protein
MPETKRVRLAIAQTVVRENPRSSTELRASGVDLRRLMREAHKAGARIVHFPEGATSSPHKLVMSTNGPDEVGPADWDRFEWDVLEQELAVTAGGARTQAVDGPRFSPSAHCAARSAQQSVRDLRPW